MRGIAIGLVAVLVSCSDRVAPSPSDAPGAPDGPVDGPVPADSVGDVDGKVRADLGADVSADCGGCPVGLTCCPSPWTTFGDSAPRCVDLQLHPEHCGECGKRCVACQDGQCFEPARCTDDGGCDDGQFCSSSTCCASGTQFITNPVSFVGCCPGGPACGCFGNGCPLSRRRYKTDIRYLTPEDIDVARERLLSISLAEYTYRDDPGRRHLGFIIDDLDEATARACVQPDGEHVDLYGYASMAVAALQAQQRELDELRRQVRELKRLVRKASPGERRRGN